MNSLPHKMDGPEQIREDNINPATSTIIYRFNCKIHKQSLQNRARFIGTLIIAHFGVVLYDGVLIARYISRLIGQSRRYNDRSDENILHVECLIKSDKQRQCNFYRKILFLNLIKKLLFFIFFAKYFINVRFSGNAQLRIQGKKY